MTNKTNIIVDTDILIDVGRGVQESVKYLREKEQLYSIAVSTITCLELLVGAQNKREQQNIERFLQRFRHVKVNETISDMAIDLIRQYRLSRGPLLADALTLAIAIVLQAPLASKNQRDYRFITQLTLLSYL